jgi:hypothetical protein
MSTMVIHFECRSATHRATRSRGGVGGIVMHHGTFGYCDGFASDNDHPGSRPAACSSSSL